MKILVMTALSLACVTALAAPKPRQEMEGKKKRGVEMSTTLKKHATKAQSRINDIIAEANVSGIRAVEIKLPESLGRDAMRKYTKDYAELAETLTTNEVVITKLKANEGNILSNFVANVKKNNELYEMRSDLVALRKGGIEGWKQDHIDALNLAIRLIDNKAVVVDVELTVHGTKDAMDFKTIETVDNFLLGVKTSHMKGQDFVDIKARIDKVLPREKDMESAARCVKELKAG